jgi:hypothetical protein
MAYQNLEIFELGLVNVLNLIDNKTIGWSYFNILYEKRIKKIPLNNHIDVFSKLLQIFHLRFSQKSGIFYQKFFVY